MKKEGELPCPQAIELLPWLLNGTLDADEAQDVRSHLETCPSCRRELGETRWAAAVFGAHVSAEALVALAWEQPERDLDLALVRRHLESCEACAQELALVRQSRGLEAVTDLRPLARPVPVVLRYGSLAAALVLGFGTGALYWRSIGDRSAEQANHLASRVGELEERVRRLRDSESDLQGALRQLQAPEPNLPVVEVLPDSSVPRSKNARETRIVVPKGARRVALVLASERLVTGPGNVELRNARGELVWTGSGLRPSPLGGFTLGLSTSLLADGTYTLLLRRDRGAAETYSLRVENER